MKKIPLLITAIILLTMGSCGCDTKPIPLTFVFDKPLNEGRYPDYFETITEPFKSEVCKNCFLLKPINVARIDIKKAPVETNAWYFEQMGDNTVEFSKNWLSQYYKDSLVIKHLTLPLKHTVSENAIDSYLSKEDVLTLIYSEESDKEFYNETPIYTSSKEVTGKIREGLCSSTYKEVVVIVNPSKLARITKPPQGDSLPPIPEIGDPLPGDPCSKSTVPDGLDLKEDLLKIIDTKRTYKERDQIAKATWSKYFDEMASVEMYLKLEDKYPDFWESGDGSGYLIDRLAYKSSITDINIIRIERHNDTGKISSMVVVECHNASEIL